MSLPIEFDPNKDVANMARHGISLKLAESLQWELLLATEDNREGYGELPMIGFAPIGRLVYFVAFTENDDTYRIISLRKATLKEVRYYAGQI